MKTAQAFLLGMLQFRRAFTTRCATEELRDAYDRGRDFAHRITFRHYED